MPIPDILREILVCTSCHGDLDERGAELVCRECGLRFPVEEGIPNMLLDEARPPENRGEPGSS